MLPWFIGAEIYRLPVFAPPHPLAVPRAMLAADLCTAMGWLKPGQYQEAGPATPAQLRRFHTPDYVAALRLAEQTQDLAPDLRARHRIGIDHNIIHPAVFRRPATSAGGALLAAEMTAAGGVVHAPGVGNHHGRPDRASGFCFVNDIALGILRWRDLGVRRVAYLDLDAHHGDGVEAAFADDPAVLTISVHEAGRWPRTGVTCEPSRGVWNFPVPVGFHDDELAVLMTQKILPLIIAHRPDGILLLPGADALADDPMARLSLSNNALMAAVGGVMGLSERLVLLGRHLGGAERLAGAGRTAAGGARGAGLGSVFSGGRPPPAGALAGDAAGCAPRRGGAG